VVSTSKKEMSTAFAMHSSDSDSDGNCSAGSEGKQLGAAVSMEKKMRAKTKMAIEKSTSKKAAWKAAAIGSLESQLKSMKAHSPSPGAAPTGSKQAIPLDIAFEGSGGGHSKPAWSAQTSAYGGNAYGGMDDDAVLRAALAASMQTAKADEEKRSLAKKSDDKPV